MSLERTQSVVNKFLDYDWSVLSADATGEIIGLNKKAKGPEAIEALGTELYSEMFEAEAEVFNVVVNESTGVVEFNFTGIHKGEFVGVRATRKTVNVPAVAIYDVAGDEITAVRVFLPIHLLLEQINGNLNLVGQDSNT